MKHQYIVLSPCAMWHRLFQPEVFCWICSKSELSNLIEYTATTVYIQTMSIVKLITSHWQTSCVCTLSYANKFGLTISINLNWVRDFNYITLYWQTVWFLIANSTRTIARTTELTANFIYRSLTWHEVLIALSKTIFQCPNCWDAVVVECHLNKSSGFLENKRQARQ